MWTRRLLKENGKIAFKRNYWSCVAVSLLLAIFTGEAISNITSRMNSGTSTTVDESALQEVILILPLIVAAFFIVFAISIAISIFLSNIFDVGGKRFFLENREHKTNVSRLLYGFNGGNYLNNVKVLFFKSLYTLGWTLLFVIPGIVKSYSYMMIPYIMAENSGISRERVFQISMTMMNGHKMEAFALDLSFLGWKIVSSVSFGILGIFYVNPYINATKAEFYSAIKAEALQRGIVSCEELPGVGYPEGEWNEGRTV